MVSVRTALIRNLFNQVKCIKLVTTGNKLSTVWYKTDRNKGPFKATRSKCAIKPLSFTAHLVSRDRGQN